MEKEIINEKWRLVEELEAIVIDSLKTIWLYPVSSKKSKRNEILKSIPNGYPIRDVHFDENLFDIELSLDIFKGIQWFINYKNTKYYVRNVEDRAQIQKDLILQSDLIKGKINKKVEAVFSDKFPGSVGFVHEDMDIYDNCFDEMVRLVNCNVKKKTRRWIPGHRYDSENETLYYLGEVYTNILDPYCSDLLEDKDLVKVHLYCNDVKGLNKISEVFKTKSINDIQVFYKLPLMVDSGEKLENDFSDYSDYFQDLQKNSKTLEEKLSTLKFVGKKKYKIDKTTLTNEIKESMFTCILNFWDINSYLAPSRILSSNTIEENTESLLKILLNYQIQENNSLAVSYYTNLLNSYGIDIRGLAKEELESFKESDINKDFDYFYKYHEDYLKHRSNRIVHINERSKSLVSNDYYDNNSMKTLETLYNNDDFTEEINNLVKYSIEKDECAIDKLVLVNIGTKRSPNEFYIAEISINNIINHNPNINSEVKKTILTNKIGHLRIEFDKDKDIK